MRNPSKANPKAKRSSWLGLAVALALFIFPAQAMAGSGGVDVTGSDAPAGARAKLVDGLAVAPVGAPPKVVRAIAAANRIVQGRTYCLGGGHQRWQSRCYDCSGTASYALGKPGARVLDAPLPSGDFMRWGERGPGEWITIYANEGHMYLVIAGLRLDTSMTDGEGPGWSTEQRKQAGFRVRHPVGL
ncbi:MAG TPA: hypothetical protein VHF58_03640 [Solirubrobacterales bacterium]|nr:hypothetical protein [Solirubrobacterales bacterium]